MLLIHLLFFGNKATRRSSCGVTVDMSQGTQSGSISAKGYHSNTGLILNDIPAGNVWQPVAVEDSRALENVCNNYTIILIIIIINMHVNFMFPWVSND